jgi:hypothetical protein
MHSREVAHDGNGHNCRSSAIMPLLASLNLRHTGTFKVVLENTNKIGTFPLLWRVLFHRIVSTDRKETCDQNGSKCVLRACQG